MRGRFDDFMKLRRPADGPPVPNQGGIPAPTGPKQQYVVPDRSGAPTGRPPMKVGRPEPPRRVDRGGYTGGMEPGQARQQVGPPPLPKQSGRAQEVNVFRDDQGRVTGTSGLTPEEQAKHDELVAGGMKSGDALGSMFGKEYGRGGSAGIPEPPPQDGREVSRGGYTGGDKGGEIPTDETGTPLQPGGVPSKQLPGVEQKMEYTVNRPMMFDEITKAPNGIINTPAIVYEKDETGIKMRDLTPAGHQALQQLRQADMKKFTGWGNEFDPNLPPPPVRPGMRAFNFMTGDWINNETSILEELGGE